MNADRDSRSTADVTRFEAGGKTHHERGEHGMTFARRDFTRPRFALELGEKLLGLLNFVGRDDRSRDAIEIDARKSGDHAAVIFRAGGVDLQSSLQPFGIEARPAEQDVRLHSGGEGRLALLAMSLETGGEGVDQFVEKSAHFGMRAHPCFPVDRPLRLSDRFVFCRIRS